MSPFMRNLHRFAIAFQAAWGLIFLWIGFDTGSVFCIALAGWCGFWIAWSRAALQADRKKGIKA